MNLISSLMFLIKVDSTLWLNWNCFKQIEKSFNKKRNISWKAKWNLFIQSNPTFLRVWVMIKSPENKSFSKLRSCKIIATWIFVGNSTERGKAFNRIFINTFAWRFFSQKNPKSKNFSAMNKYLTKCCSNFPEKDFIFRCLPSHKFFLVKLTKLFDLSEGAGKAWIIDKLSLSWK